MATVCADSNAESFRIKACIHEFLTDAALKDTGVEYIAKATPARFSSSNKSHSERAAN
jgi:hypothetical protein